MLEKHLGVYNLGYPLQGAQRLLHLSLADADSFSVVADSDHVSSFAIALPYAEGHLGRSLLQLVLSNVYQLQLVFYATFVVFGREVSRLSDSFLEFLVYATNYHPRQAIR